MSTSVRMLVVSALRCLVWVSDDVVEGGWLPGDARLESAVTGPLHVLDLLSGYTLVYYEHHHVDAQ